jgi:polyhydroxybutyrate depolymerase
VINRLRSIWAWIERLRSRRLISAAVSHNGIVRRYLLYVPRHFRSSGAALPLVLLFHGGSGAPRAIARRTGMHYIAEREGFIVAYPAGTPARRGLTWNAGGHELAANVDDVGFVRVLLDDLERRYGVDHRRVYAAGLSLGGMLAYRLACMLSDRFAAIAVVAGTMTTENCRPAQPVSVLHIHGTADQRVPLRGGHGRFSAARNNWPSVLDGIERWCTINHCAKPGQVVRLVDGLVGHRYTGDADVEFWLIEGGRHGWPGVTTRGWAWRRRAAPPGFNASEKVWTFFADHART